MMMTMVCGLLVKCAGSSQDAYYEIIKSMGGYFSECS